MVVARYYTAKTRIARLIDSIRRECLDHVIVSNAGHLYRVLLYYRQRRTHRTLDQDCPQPRSVALPDKGKIVELPLVNGLHHRYGREAAEKLDSLRQSSTGALS